VALAVLVDLVRIRSDDDLVDQHLGERAPINTLSVVMTDCLPSARYE